MGLEKDHFKPQLVSFSIKAETLNYSLTSRCVGSKDAYFANDKAMGANTKQLSEHALTGDIKTR